MCDARARRKPGAPAGQWQWHPGAWAEWQRAAQNDEQFQAQGLQNAASTEASPVGRCPSHPAGSACPVKDWHIVASALVMLSVLEQTAKQEGYCSHTTQVLLTTWHYEAQDSNHGG